MRKLLLSAALFLAACGGGSSSNNNPGPLAGTFGGTAFSPVSVKALAIGTGSNACTQIPALNTAGIKAIALQVTSYGPDACGDFASAQCVFHKSAETVTVLVAKLNPNAPYTEPTIPAGTYAIASAPVPTTPPDASGILTVGYAQATTTDSTCNGGSPTPSAATSGTIHLDQTIGATVTGPITGHLSIAFANGGSLGGGFSAELCSENLNVCDLVTSATIAYGLRQPSMLYCSMPGTCP